jgi:Uma2 family endonuclease
MLRPLVRRPTTPHHHIAVSSGRASINFLALTLHGLHLLVHGGYNNRYQSRDSSMIAPTPPLPLLGTMAGLRRFSVPEYHKLTEIGVLTEDDNLELIEGYLVLKMSRNPPHDGTIQIDSQALAAALPPGWCVRVQCAVTLPDSEPEPDIAVVRGNARSYLVHHPGPTEIGALLEVADSSLLGDRSDKGRIYARALIPVYWIINLIDRQIEVHEQPSGPTTAPAYAKITTYHPGDSVPLTLDGNTVAMFAAQDLLP